MVEKVAVAAYEVGTDEHESDGTLEWDSTTLVVVDITAGGTAGLGYTYAPAAAAQLVVDQLAPALRGLDPLAVGAVWATLAARLRNAGHPGLGFSALSAVDIALWDLKARLLDLPLVTLLDRVRDSVPVYASGGFTSYSDARLEEQLGGWVEQGIPRVKIKVGRDPGRDAHRLDVARRAVGDEAELYVDANGAFDAKQALAWASASPASGE